MNDAVWLVGCGAMAGAILGRWVEAGGDPAHYTAIDPALPTVPAGVRVLAVAPAEPPPRWLLLGVKPQALDAVAPAVAAALGPGTTLLSILAGVRLATLQERFPGAGAVVRAMPNLPVRRGEGVVALAGTVDRGEVDALMAPLGLLEWFDDETRFDLVTALSGSGPAFVYRFVDALARGAAARGMPAEQADRIARATVRGAAALAAAAPEPLAALADRVASRGGSTRAGLDVLDADEALARLVGDALDAAAARNTALGTMPGAEPRSR